jgi:hypothetical protein
MTAMVVATYGWYVHVFDCAPPDDFSLKPMLVLNPLDQIHQVAVRIEPYRHTKHPQVGYPATHVDPRFT